MNVSPSAVLPASGLLSPSNRVNSVPSSSTCLTVSPSALNCTHVPPAYDMAEPPSASYSIVNVSPSAVLPASGLLSSSNCVNWVPSASTCRTVSPSALKTTNVPSAYDMVEPPPASYSIVNVSPSGVLPASGLLSSSNDVKTVPSGSVCRSTSPSALNCTDAPSA